jgi:hypothetical protein
VQTAINLEKATAATLTSTAHICKPFKSESAIFAFSFHRFFFPGFQLAGNPSQSESPS